MGTVIRGYHVYMDIWTPEVHEKFACHQESGNEHVRFAIAIFTGGENILGHLTLTNGIRVALSLGVLGIEGVPNSTLLSQLKANVSSKHEVQLPCEGIHLRYDDK